MENEGAREYSISELAEEAGVSTRTIRYYVSEGLLPPPVGAGPNSRYTDAHLHQLGDHRPPEGAIPAPAGDQAPIDRPRRLPVGPGRRAAPSEYHGPSRRSREIAEDQAVNRSMPPPRLAAPVSSAPTGTRTPARTGATRASGARAGVAASRHLGRGRVADHRGAVPATPGQDRLADPVGTAGPRNLTARKYRLTNRSH